MTATVALFGAGGTMGCRIAENASDHPEYDVVCVEPSEEGIDRLRDRGFSVTPESEALRAADAVVLAVPDQLIGEVCADVVPRLDSGTMVVALDPAAAYAGQFPDRSDVSYFVTHPCHPHLFEAPADTDGGTDWFGGQGDLEQPLVCALHSGPEEAYERGERLARAIFAPVSRTHRVTVEQMAVLEPALVENVLTTFLLGLRDAFDAAVATGVPEAAADDMLFGHVRTQVAMFFGELDHPISDGAELAVDQGRERILKDGWLDVMDVETVRRNCEAIAELERGSDRSSR